jgi:hypothetical protein
MMKTNFNSFRFALIASLIAVSQGDAAVLVVDDFASGGFSVSESYPTMREIGLSLPIGENVSRLVSGDGLAYWNAQSSPLFGGSMNYTLELRGDPIHVQSYLNVSYQRSGGFDLSGYDAFSLSISNLVGRGEIIAYSGSFKGIPVPITGTGELLIPFELMQNSLPLDRLLSLHFRFIGLSKDFSVTVDRIAAVPEPSGACLALLGSLMLLFRRRRATAVTPRQA